MIDDQTYHWPLELLSKLVPFLQTLQNSVFSCGFWDHLPLKNLGPYKTTEPSHPAIQTQTDPVSDAAHLTLAAQQLQYFNLNISWFFFKLTIHTILFLIPSKSMKVHHATHSMWKQNNSIKPQPVELDHQSLLRGAWGKTWGVHFQVK